MTTIAVTGASGMLGRHLVRHLAAEGAAVRALVRDPAAWAACEPTVPAARCDLPDGLDDAALAGVDVLVHAAWATKETDPARARRVNVDGTRRLLDAARRAGVARRVFVSSIAARADAPSAYARTKHEVEAFFDPGRDLVVRPGLVLAREGRGLFQTLRDVVRRLHVVPLFGGGRQPFQTVHVHDLCAAVSAGLARGLTGVVRVAEPEPLPMRAFFALLARRLGVRCVFVPLPFAPVLGVLRTLERLQVPVPLRSESLLGLAGMTRVDVRPDLERLGLRPRAAATSLDDTARPA